MKKTKDLFELIKSLSKSEKRYFKLFVSRHKSVQHNNTVILFDLYEGLKKYDEELLLKKLNAYPSIKKNVRLNCFYLYKQVLRSLETYHYKMDTDAELQSSLSQIKILFKRSLFEQCLRVIDHASKLAIQEEKFIFIYELILRKIEVWNAYKNADETKINNELISLRHTINALSELGNYTGLHSRMMFNINKIGASRTKEHFNSFKKITGHPLLSTSLKENASIRSRFYYYYCYRFYYKGMNDPVNAYKCDMELIALIDKYPFFIRENLPVCTSILSNLTDMQIMLGKYAEAEKNIAKITKLEKQFPFASESLFFAANYLKLKYFDKTGAFDKAVNIIPTVNKKLEDAGGKYISDIHYIGFRLFFTKAYFGAGNFTKANYWLNIIINTIKDDYFKSRMYVPRIISLVISYEMGKHDLLEYTVKSTYRFLLKQDKLYKVEKLVLDFIRKQSRKNPDNKKMIKAFKGLQIEMIKLQKDPLEKNAFEYFDFIGWLDSKIENRSFADVVREKANVQIK